MAGATSGRGQTSYRSKIKNYQIAINLRELTFRLRVRLKTISQSEAFKGSLERALTTAHNMKEQSNHRKISTYARNMRDSDTADPRGYKFLGGPQQGQLYTKEKPKPQEKKVMAGQTNRGYQSQLSREQTDSMVLMV